VLHVCMGTCVRVCVCACVCACVCVCMPQRLEVCVQKRQRPEREGETKDQIHRDNRRTSADTMIF